MDSQDRMSPDFSTRRITENKSIQDNLGAITPTEIIKERYENADNINKAKDIVRMVNTELRNRWNRPLGYSEEISVIVEANDIVEDISRNQFKKAGWVVDSEDNSDGTYKWLIKKV